MFPLSEAQHLHFAKMVVDDFPLDERMWWRESDGGHEGNMRNVSESKQTFDMPSEQKEAMKPFFDTMYAPLRDGFAKERGVN